MKLVPVFPGDEKIVELLKGRDAEMEEGLRILYREYFPYLKNYILTNSGSEQDAEDMFQEAIIAFVNAVRAGKFRGEASIRTYLFAMNRNLWLNEVKKRGRSSVREENYGKQSPANEAELQSHIEIRQSQLELMRILEALGEACKKLLLLFYFENRSMTEIAGFLEYENEQVARNKKFKCLKKMEKLVTENRAVYQTLKNYLHE